MGLPATSTTRRTRAFRAGGYVNKRVTTRGGLIGSQKRFPARRVRWAGEGKGVLAGKHGGGPPGGRNPGDGADSKGPTG